MTCAQRFKLYCPDLELHPALNAKTATVRVYSLERIVVYSEAFINQCGPAQLYFLARWCYHLAAGKCSVRAAIVAVADCAGMSICRNQLLTDCPDQIRLLLPG
jgi:hypothetical protein